VGKHQGALAITGMKLGAFRDVQTPIHFEALRDIIKQAYKARTKKKRKRAARRLIGAAPRIFAAITFAEHGEFETAKKCLDSDLERRENDK
jgi:DNA-binding NtrC family response regulator